MTITIARARLACVGLIVGLLACFASAQSADAKTIRLSWLGAPTNAAVAVAIGEGIFKKHGVDVKATRGTASVPLVTLGKQYDIVNTSVSDIILFANRGGDPLVVNGGQVLFKPNVPPDMMVQKGITSLKQLKGKTIGTLGVGSSQLWAGAAVALQKAGLDWKKDVKFVEVPFPSQLDALRAGRIDAAVGVQPFLNQMKAAGYGPLSSVLGAVANPVIGAQFVAKASAVKKNPKDYTDFQKAYSEAINTIKKNPALGYRYIQSELNLPAAAARATDFAPLQPLVKPKWITNWVKPMERLGVVKKSKKLGKRNFVFQPGKNPKPAKK